MNKTYRAVVTGQLYHKRTSGGNVYYLDVLDNADELTGITICIETDYSTKSLAVNEMVKITIQE